MIGAVPLARVAVSLDVPKGSSVCLIRRKRQLGRTKRNQKKNNRAGIAPGLLGAFQRKGLAHPQVSAGTSGRAYGAAHLFAPYPFLMPCPPRDGFDLFSAKEGVSTMLEVVNFKLRHTWCFERCDPTVPCEACERLCDVVLDQDVFASAASHLFSVPASLFSVAPSPFLELAGWSVPLCEIGGNGNCSSRLVLSS